MPLLFLSFGWTNRFVLTFVRGRGWQMFPLTGSRGQPGGNGFPFIIFFLGVLERVGLATPWLEHRSDPLCGG